MIAADPFGPAFAVLAGFKSGAMRYNSTADTVTRFHDRDRYSGIKERGGGG
jgi:hypothetical protein